ncbi:Cytoplasmic and mitochondrial histidine tRNA synthetase [Tulasnella sp. 330]|nr:Cytoplasmic and mitochondrial histidine tRNA synthetase [Tulasnella sp. 330]KAG8872177.1 Cytoplasmic and mitochondrial histidine tRNA synthetase [Tulasnella sp. 331]KAG8873850.1 Cytoplasmic and mitochondrial histidine tRNA synthetase [Tulasnella sp. 332]
MSELADLTASIATTSESLRTLQARKADAAAIAEEKKKLGELKKQLAVLSGTAAGGGSKDTKDKDAAKKAGARLQLKTPKGTRDWSPQEMSIREHIFNTLTTVFKQHGGSTIDTPVFELREILAGKYGEDSKLIYDLQDQGGEICSLRYDLTVPFARFLAMNGTAYPSIKRYHIAKVYRRDQPAMTKGRMREFYQCDFDIAGIFDPMVPDAEILVIVCEALTALEIGEFTIKINHRKILDGIFEVCGVPVEKIRMISSAVDKLDKSPWSEVRREMTEEKGLDGGVADQIGEYVKLKGGSELIAKLRETKLLENASAKAGLEDMELLFKYLEVFGVANKMSLDMSLARGLDYYTGVIYEAVCEASAPPGFSVNPPTADQPQTQVPTPEGSAAPPKSSKKSKPSKDKDADGTAAAEPEIDETQIGVGSIAAGGRYDELVGMFASAASGESSKGKKSTAGLGIPCVGVSVGVERVFSLLREKMMKEEGKLRGKETQVYVMSVGDGLLVERMGIVKRLWDAGIKTEFMYKAKPKLRAQFEYCDKELIPFAVILGPDELREGFVRVKEQRGKDADSSAGDGEKVKIEELAGWLRERL